MAPEQDTPLAESGAILSGPGDSIFDDIFDWIANAISSITGAVDEWITWLWSKVTETIVSWITWLWSSSATWFEGVYSRLRAWGETIEELIADRVGELWTWISSGLGSLGGMIRAWISEIPDQLDYIKSAIVDKVSREVQNLRDLQLGLYDQTSRLLSDSIAWLTTSVQSQLSGVVTEIRSLIPEWLYQPGQWIQQLLDGVATWLEEDIPGHSPRWTAIFDNIGSWIANQFSLMFREGVGEFPRVFANDLLVQLRFLGEGFNLVFDQFTSSVTGFIRQLGPMSPETAVENYSSIAKVGATALAGLAGMTLAGSWLKPLGGAGLGNIAAMVYDMTNYKLITGAFMGAMTVSMLKTPLTYYFNDLFRPWLISPRDFMELMSRRAFSDPDTLQNPELSATMAKIAPAGGAQFEASMVGYYGYRSEYLGLFRELANTRLGYFALAGIARTGFYEHKWFVEALARTGYSDTARKQLLKMYRVQATEARQGLVKGYIQRNVREGYFTLEEADTRLKEAAKIDDLDKIRVMAMAMDRDYQVNSMALDINLGTFSRGIITESECRKNLEGLLVDPSLVDVNLAREKLGIIRRITWTPPETEPAFQIVEE
jgi:hypothetical protein